MSQKQVLQYGVLALCAGIIIQYFLPRRDELKRILDLQGHDVVLLLTLGVLIHVLMGYKMLFILRKLGLRHISWLSWFRIFSVSRFFSLYVAQGANVYRGIKLKQDYAFSYTDSLSTMTILSWFEAIFAISVSMMIIFCSDHEVSVGGIKVIVALGLLLVFFIFMPFLGKNVLRRLQFKKYKMAWLQEKLVHVTGALTGNMKDPKLLITFFAFNVITFLFFVMQISVTFNAIGTPIRLAEVVLFTALTLLSGIINITPGNVGIIELTYGYLSSILGKSMGSGIIVCGILRILGYLVVVFFALIFSHPSLGGVRKSREETIVGS